MVFLVVGTQRSAISLAREEHEHREAEIFEYRAEQAEEVEEGEEPISEQPTDEEPVQGGDLALTSPDAGDLIFEPEALEAEAGEVVLTYTNPSEVPHNVAIEAGRRGARPERDGHRRRERRRHRRARARRVRLLLLGPRPPRGRDGRRPHRQVAHRYPARGCRATT